MACRKRLLIGDNQYSELFDSLMDTYFNVDKALEQYILIGGEKGKDNFKAEKLIPISDVDQASVKRMMSNTNKLVEDDNGVILNVYSNSFKSPSPSYTSLVSLYNGNNTLAFQEFSLNYDLYKLHDSLIANKMVEFTCK